MYTWLSNAFSGIFKGERPSNEVKVNETRKAQVRNHQRTGSKPATIFQQGNATTIFKRDALNKTIEMKSSNPRLMSPVSANESLVHDLNVKNLSARKLPARKRSREEALQDGSQQQTAPPPKRGRLSWRSPNLLSRIAVFNSSKCGEEALNCTNICGKQDRESASRKNKAARFSTRQDNKCTVEIVDGEKWFPAVSDLEELTEIESVHATPTNSANFVSTQLNTAKIESGRGEQRGIKDSKAIADNAVSSQQVNSQGELSKVSRTEKSFCAAEKMQGREMATKVYQISNTINSPRSSRNWNKQYERLLRFTEAYTRSSPNALPPALSSWLDIQIAKYAQVKSGSAGAGLLTSNQMKKLEAVGATDELVSSHSSATESSGASQTFGRMVERLELFKEVYGHCSVPCNHGDRELANWVSKTRRKQREGKKPMPKVERDCLDKLGFDWNPRGSKLACVPLVGERCVSNASGHNM